MVKTQKRNKSKIRSKKTKFLRKKKIIGGTKRSATTSNGRLAVPPQVPPRLFRPPVVPPRSLTPTVLGTPLPPAPVQPTYESPFQEPLEYANVNNNNSAYVSGVSESASSMYAIPSRNTSRSHSPALAATNNLYATVPGNENFLVPQIRGQPEPPSLELLKGTIKRDTARERGRILLRQMEQLVG